MDDIFTEVVTNDEITIPDNPFETLVGDGKRYSDQNALAKAAFEKDKHIKRLEAENASFRQQITQHSTMDEILTQIRTASTATQTPPSTPPSQNEQRVATPNTDEVKSLVEKLIADRENQNKVQTNRAKVQQRLEEHWGADATVNLNNKARELGLTIQQLAKLADENPSVFFKAIDVPVARTTQSSPTQVVPHSQASVQPQGGTVRNAAYYEKLKQQNPTEYFSDKIRMQQMKDAMNLGDKYYQ